MQESIANNRQIAKNTLMLYVRMALTIVVQLYSVPIVLRNLGASDYGLYNVVGGIVAMFSFLSNSLVSGTQRYIAFALGRKDQQLLLNTFQTIKTIYYAFAIILFILVEIIGLWFLHFKMSIPEGRMWAADWVFQFSVITFIANILYIPYNSALIAHERMSIYAYVSIIECLAKLSLAISLSYIAFDKLVYYAALLFVLVISIQLFYLIYCFRYFEECRNFRVRWNPEIGRSLLNYSGWTMIGTLSQVGRSQGLNILMNLFFSTILNAAHAIATQVSGVINQFVTNLYMATRPPITKLYASGDIHGMWSLVFRSAKLAFFLLTFLCIPAMVEMDYILKIWLHDFPEYTVSIVNTLILIILVETLVNQLVSAFQAANKIKRCQRDCGCIILMCLPLSYVFLRFFQSSPLTAYHISLLLSVIYVVYLVYLAKREIGLNAISYLREVLLKDIAVFGLTLLVVYVVRIQIAPSIIRFLITIVVSTSIALSLIWLIGLNTNEKIFVINFIKSKCNRKWGYY